MPLVVKKFGRIKPEHLSLPIPEGVKKGQLVGKQGKNRKELESQINEALAKFLPNASPEEVSRLCQLTISETHIQMVLDPRIKPFAGVALGIVRSRIHALGGDFLLSPPPMVVTKDALPSDVPSALDNPRLGYLTASVPPPHPKDRDSAVLYLVWVLLHQCQCQVYGGFVRDWVVRGESANDIDCVCPAAKRDEVKGTLRAAIQGKGITMGSARTKGAAHAVQFTFGGTPPIDIDLVDTANVPYTAPGVDCDSGNIALSPNGVYCLKVNKPFLCDLATSIKHCLAKKFVYYYAPGASCTSQRLGKYFERGWTCLNNVAHPLAAQNQHLVHAKGKYDKTYWTMG